ncbi:MAG: flippase-like domain-containing protein [Caldilineaceae bacterium]|nr:flippase-like domain-containing protein [Caldilineaceae bacterium]
MLRRLFLWLQPAAFILSLFAIGWFLAIQWSALRNYPWRLDWGWLLATCVLTLASWGIEVAIWRHLLFTLGGKLPYWVAVRLWFLSAVVRYLPGSIWQPLSLTLHSRRHGVAPEATITSLILFQVITLLAIAPIFVIYFLWIDTKSLAAQFVAEFPPALIWAVLIPLVLFLLRPQWLPLLLNWALARIGRPPLDTQLTSRALLTLIFVAWVDWILWGGVFAAFTFAVAGAGVSGGTQLAPLLVASFPIASAIGFLSVITPSGFGVREGAMYLLLTPQIAGSVVTVIALAVRVWGILGELLMALISTPFEHASTRANPVDIPLPIDSPLPDPVVNSDLRRETT